MRHVLCVDWKGCATDQVNRMGPISHIGLDGCDGIDIDSDKVLQTSATVVSKRNKLRHFNSKI